MMIQMQQMLAIHSCATIIARESIDMSSPAILENRVAAVERLMHLFRMERIVYLFVTSISLIVLLAVAIRMYVAGESSIPVWGLMFGSSGLITITANRLLQMWSQSLRMVASEPVNGHGKEASNG
jgi:hypothetical protein